VSSSKNLSSLLPDADPPGAEKVSFLQPRFPLSARDAVRGIVARGTDRCVQPCSLVEKHGYPSVDFSLAYTFKPRLEKKADLDDGEYLNQEFYPIAASCSPIPNADINPADRHGTPENGKTQTFCRLLLFSVEEKIGSVSV